VLFFMELTNRDLQLLNDLYFVKYLNSRRIGSLFGYYKSALRRLKGLKDEGYIKVVDFLANGEQVFCLTKRGFNLLNKNYYYLSKNDKIIHNLLCGDFYFWLKGRGHNIEYFSIDEQVSYRYKGKNIKFRPDIIVKTDRWYLVEVDLCNKRFEEKVKKWEGYYESSIFKTRFELFPPIIIVSNNIDKVRAIINKYRQIDLNYAYIDIEYVKNNQYTYSKT